MASQLLQLKQPRSRQSLGGPVVMMVPVTATNLPMSCEVRLLLGETLWRRTTVFFLLWSTDRERAMELIQVWGSAVKTSRSEFCWSRASTSCWMSMVHSTKVGKACSL